MKQNRKKRRAACWLKGLDSADAAEKRKKQWAEFEAWLKANAEIPASDLLQCAEVVMLEHELHMRGVKEFRDLNGVVHTDPPGDAAPYAYYM